MIPYGKQCIDEDDIRAVVDVLRSDWLTTGPKVEEFERAFAEFCGVKHAVAVSNGTAALHCAMYAAGIGPGDEVLVPPMSFAASANCVVFQGGTPVFVDVRDEDLLVNPEKIEAGITPKTKGIIAVDYAGMPCDYDRLRQISDKHGLFLVADACHSVGGSYKGRPVGSLADMSCFSFHPVKNMTTGEGGMVTTDDDEYARRIRLFRNHGITTDFRERQQTASWHYEMADLGWNYRITDMQCALGLSQLKKLPGWIKRRNEIAATYDAAFSLMKEKLKVVGHGSCSLINDKLLGKGSLQEPSNSSTQQLINQTTVHGRHLYPIRVPAERRSDIFAKLRAKGIGVNVHYIPIHLHPYYRETLGTGPGDCPVAEQAYEELISLPMYPGMMDEEVETVISTVMKYIRAE